VPSVLLHGHPETARVWDALRARLTRTDVLAPGLPGYGTPRPEGFAATKEAYLDWLVETLESFGEPVDLVGHDWGGILAVRLATVRPDLLRSWASDAVGVFRPDHDWHRLAKVWQTPGRGEKAVRRALGSSERETIQAYSEWDVGPEDARRIRGEWSETMWACALDLYRSAVEIGPEWATDVGRAASRPGLAIVATADHVGDVEHDIEVARRAGAEVARLEGLGHWWLLQDPAVGAALLEAFWQGTGA
jgi:pimeloyl-ACP methyl ester carboxylesterase